MTDEGARYSALWQRIMNPPCERCVKGASGVTAEILAKERYFWPLHGPGISTPGKRVKYILVAMEPSTRWAGARSPAEARAASGSKVFNFNTQRGDFALRYAANTWLCPPESNSSYVLTDFARCSISNDKKAADRTRLYRYATCQPYLEEEIALFDRPTLIGIGQTVAKRLATTFGNTYRVESIVHYSTQALWKVRRELDSVFSRETWQASIESVEADFAAWMSAQVGLTVSDATRRLLAAYRLRFLEIAGR